jgi:hypothetical protein
MSGINYEVFTDVQRPWIKKWPRPLVKIIERNERGDQGSLHKLQS